ncbi:Protein inscuteable [Trichinella pseudospiralis]
MGVSQSTDRQPLRLFDSTNASLLEWLGTVRLGQDWECSAIMVAKTIPLPTESRHLDTGRKNSDQLANDSTVYATLKNVDLLQPTVSDSLSFDSACGSMPSDATPSSTSCRWDPLQLRDDCSDSDQLSPTYESLKDYFDCILDMCVETDFAASKAISQDDPSDDANLTLQICTSRLRSVVTKLISDTSNCLPFVETTSAHAQAVTLTSAIYDRFSKAIVDFWIIASKQKRFDRILLCDSLSHFLKLVNGGSRPSLLAVRHGAVAALFRILQNCHVEPEAKLGLQCLYALSQVQSSQAQLNSINGMEVILKLVVNGPAKAAREAARLLAVVACPSHSVWLYSMPCNMLFQRLLDLCDHTLNPTSLLHYISALANLTVHYKSTCDALYELNAVQRIIKLYNWGLCDSTAIQYQILSIFANMAISGHCQVLIVQGAVNFLLHMLLLRPVDDRSVCAEIRYKAALCLKTIATTSEGLKAIFSANGLHAVSTFLKLSTTKGAERFKASVNCFICRIMNERDNVWNFELCCYT